VLGNHIIFTHTVECKVMFQSCKDENQFSFRRIYGAQVDESLIRTHWNNQKI